MITSNIDVDVGTLRHIEHIHEEVDDVDDMIDDDNAVQRNTIESDQTLA